MKTGARTTYILLDKGSEDKALRIELMKLIAEAGHGLGLAFYKAYPTIGELLSALRDETREPEND